MDEWSVELFWEKVERQPNGCWLWTGAVLRNGYGVVGIARVMQLAHRVSWWLATGTWPNVTDHVCHNEDLTCQGGDQCLHRRCVNPWHLRSVTQKENMEASPLFGQAKNCRKGHEWTPENTYTTRDGRRQCRACRLIRKREYTKERRALGL